MSEAVDIRNVKFTETASEHCECQPQNEAAQEKKRNLTMKYGQAQRKIVQRRLRVEYWLDSELSRLFGITDPNETYPCDPDLDEIMELETDEERRKAILELLKSCKQTDQVIQVFINELLEKMRTL